MVTILAFLFVFSLIVVVHELGHFWVARACGVRIDAFSLGFGPTLASVTDRRGTVWRLSAIPVGGYVKFFGDASAASTPDVSHLEAMRAEIESTHGAEAVAECYHFKPVWQRALVAAAGPVANFILAIVIFTAAVFISGETSYVPRVLSIEADSPAAAAGFEKGDLITAVRGRHVDSAREVDLFTQTSAGDRATITVERDGQPVDLEVTVGRRLMDDPLGGQSAMGYLGIDFGLAPRLDAPVEGSHAEAAGFAAGAFVLAADGQPIDDFAEIRAAVAATDSDTLVLTVERDGRTLDIVTGYDTAPTEGDAPPRRSVGLYADIEGQLRRVRYGPIGSFTQGASWAWETAATQVRYLSRVVTGRESGSDLGGVLRIGKLAGTIAGDAYEQGAGGGQLAGLANAFVQLILLAGALSVSIGMLNLLPIPILDGGHLVYYGYEAVAGRPLGEGAQEWGFRIGLALVLGLTIFATWNDLRYLRVFEAIGNVLS